MIDRDRALILLVDADDALRPVTCRALEPVGRVTAVDSVDAAMAELASQLPDLVVTDVMMPGTKGLELCRRIRADVRTRETPVLVMTEGDADESKGDEDGSENREDDEQADGDEEESRRRRGRGDELVEAGWEILTAVLISDVRYIDPTADRTVDWEYAVVAVDQAGNVSEPVMYTSRSETTE